MKVSDAFPRVPFTTVCELDSTFFLVFFYIFEAPLASDDEDSQNDKDSWTEETNDLLIHQLFHSNENETMDMSMSSRPRSSRAKKASAVVVPLSTLNIIDNDTGARIVRIRLVFIHIGEREPVLSAPSALPLFRRDRYIEWEVSSGCLLWSPVEGETHQHEHAESHSSTASAASTREHLREAEWIQFERCLVTPTIHRECHRTDRCSR